jgi:hypothetical protein
MLTSKPITLKARLLMFAIPVLFILCLWIATGEQEKRQEAKVQANVAREAARMCAAWRASADDFVACTLAYDIWRRCNIGLRRLTDGGALGVICEHPTYRFQAQTQASIDQLNAELAAGQAKELAKKPTQ